LGVAIENRTFGTLWMVLMEHQNSRGVWRYLFIIDHEGHSYFGATRPICFGRVAAITDEVACEVVFAILIWVGVGGV
jgi:hypothetical protein